MQSRRRPAQTLPAPVAQGMVAAVEGQTMDPISALVTALAVGAAAGLKESTSRAIGDAYSALKSLVKKRFDKADLQGIERSPGSSSARTQLETSLRDAVSKDAVADPA